jgi:hypothetical protein
VEKRTYLMESIECGREKRFDGKQRMWKRKHIQSKAENVEKKRDLMERIEYGRENRFDGKQRM